MDFNEMTVEELETLAVEVKDALKAKKVEAKVEAKVEKAERAEFFKDSLNTGDVVSFLYGKDNEVCEGTVIRTSEKTATVESNVFTKGKSYVRYDRFVEVLEEAEVEKTDLDEAV